MLKQYIFLEADYLYLFISIYIYIYLYISIDHQLFSIYPVHFLFSIFYPLFSIFNLRDFAAIFKRFTHYALLKLTKMVDRSGLEPPTFSLRTRHSPNWTTGPYTSIAYCVSRIAYRVSSIKHRASSIKHRASSIKSIPALSPALSIVNFKSKISRVTKNRRGKLICGVR